MDFNKIFDSNDNSFDIVPITILQRFENQVKVCIPYYQRPYSWKKSQINDMLEDIDELLLRKKQNGWYLGPLYLVKTTSDSVEVLDGQQRLTTVFILLRELQLATLALNQVRQELTPEERTTFNSRKDFLRRSIFSTLSSGELVPLFTPLDQLEGLYKSYTVELDSFDRYKEAQLARAKIIESFSKGTNAEIPGSEQFASAIEQISESVESKFNLQNPTSSDVRTFLRYLDQFLNKLWFIQVTFRTSSQVVDIFEGINNRGLTLSLIDKVRFTSISNTEKQADYVDKWKQIYNGLFKLCSTLGYSSENDFFRYFLNTEANGDETSETVLLANLKSRYIKNGVFQDSFFKDVERALEFCTSLRQPKAWEVRIIDNLPHDIQHHSRLLLHLVLHIDKSFKPSRFLLFYLLRYFDPKEKSFWEEVEKYIDIVFRAECIERLSSQKGRSRYFSLMKGGGKLGSVYLNQEDLLKSKALLKLISTRRNEISKLILLYYSINNDDTALYTDNPIQYTKTHVDHILPLKWQQYWSDKEYTKEECVEYISEFDDFLFRYLSREDVLNEINTNEDFTLVISSSQKNRREGRLIEYCGNKIVLFHKENTAGGNRGYIKKKELVKIKNNIVVPSLYGYSHYQDFGAMQILERSLIILNGVVDRYIDRIQISQ